MKSSSLYITDTFPTVTGDDGIEQPIGGFVQVGTADDGRVILHAEPGRSPLPGMEALLSGKGWKWIDLKEKFPEHADQVLQAVWDSGRKDEEGQPTFERGPISRGKSRGRIPGAIETDLPPHAWLGEKEK